ncbi:hypothetical protein KIN20_026455 [Parelaphostrongylus tenuis]|uniref:Uncharacterized protein n=1 Tax=Parelaphostrongylus tenuis TaxID=148309 RepID=A0AAD5WCU2_PARTN|nr:hypothetical protein KIN20_026455 [Parelaphostrongylus tenuis]
MSAVMMEIMIVMALLKPRAAAFQPRQLHSCLSFGQYFGDLQLYRGSDDQQFALDVYKHREVAHVNHFQHVLLNYVLTKLHKTQNHWTSEANADPCGSAILDNHFLDEVIDIHIHSSQTTEASTSLVRLAVQWVFAKDSGFTFATRYSSY